jgi:hypothetical protein
MKRFGKAHKLKTKSQKPKPNLENVCFFQVAYASLKMHTPLKHTSFKG